MQFWRLVMMRQWNAERALAAILHTSPLAAESLQREVFSSVCFLVEPQHGRWLYILTPPPAALWARLSPALPLAAGPSRLALFAALSSPAVGGE